MLARFIAARAAMMAVIVNRAAERGEVPPGTDAAGVIQIVTAQLYYRLLTAGEPPGQDAADRAAAIAAAAARAGVLAERPGPRGGGPGGEP
jgi:Tetracyclin repressor-like, C-terminal domain